MSGHTSGKPSLPRASLKSVRTRDARCTGPDKKATPRMTQERAEATLVSLGLQSPRRPTIEPQSDELLTQQRQDEEALLRAIEAAMTRNDDASAEALRLQLKAVQQQGVALRERLASTTPGTVEQLRACRQQLDRELETAGPLKDEFQAARDYVQALETRIEASAARVEYLAKKVDALLAPATHKPEMKHGTLSDVALLRRCDIESHQQSGRVWHSQSLINAGPQWLVNQERTMSSGIGKSLGKREKHGTTGEGKKPEHKSRVKDSQRKARQTLNLAGGQDDYVIPSTPLGKGRATVDFSSSNSSSVLPTYADRKEHDPRRTWSPRSPGQTPRGKPSIQKQIPTLGSGRNVHEVIRELVGSVKDASEEQIRKALEHLGVMVGSDVNLKSAVQDYKRKAQAARREMGNLEQRAIDMEEQAAVLQKLSEGGIAQCEKAIVELNAELERRAMTSVEYGQVEEATTSFGEGTFGGATLKLTELIDELTRADEKAEAETREKQRADSVRNVRPSKPVAAVETGTASPDKIERKVAEHKSRVEQLKALLADAQAKLEKWDGMANANL
ncbi:hypothetical protein SAMN02787076_00614 [Rhizobacter sp. OV335]|nr:hypothetical protein SAMN02787076_00614 [Rhizobacter sp. OV335]